MKNIYLSCLLMTVLIDGSNRRYHDAKNLGPFYQGMESLLGGTLKENLNLGTVSTAGL
jgi:hypothetical protein